MALPEQSMELRTLREAELPQWFDHLAECFPTTGNSNLGVLFALIHSGIKLISLHYGGGKFYFQQHWENDTDAAVERIFIAMDLRTGVYIRTIYVQGHEVRCAAIGEVSTKERFRKQGLAQKLLALATQAAAQWCAHFYTKLGWQAVSQQMAHIAPTREGLRKWLGTRLTDGNVTCEKVDTEAFAQLAVHMCDEYNAYAKQYNGTFVRTPAYYNTWVSASFRVFPGLLIAAFDRKRSLLGYLAFQTTSERLLVKEFIATHGTSREDSELLLAQLLLSALESANIVDGSKLLLVSPLTFHLSNVPNHPLYHISLDITAANMYRVLDPRKLPPGIKIPESLEGSGAAYPEVSRHCFFPIDSY